MFSWEIGNEFFPLYNVVWLLFVSCDNSGERCIFFFLGGMIPNQVLLLLTLGEYFR